MKQRREAKHTKAETKKAEKEERGERDKINIKKHATDMPHAYTACMDR